ncbi:546_t:CDS:2 [Acaulospora colombiana]|uniref:546_t:CDS:1 n=1 Tax=Acaulospora colombiana TaxID=27376 RepID=A0ACA9LSM9_9GLOM|nr:546_t:CDS:2 [Acaulospora colombiana]
MDIGGTFNSPAFAVLPLKRNDSPIKRTPLGSSFLADNSSAIVYTCPAGDYACQDSEGGCCPYGSNCIPNYECSDPSYPSSYKNSEGNSLSSEGSHFTKWLILTSATIIYFIFRI